MITRLFFMAIPFFMAGMLLTGCGKKSTRVSQGNQKDTLVTDIKNEREDIKISIQEDWERFKASSQQAFQNTEEEISILRGRLVTSSKVQREKLNKELDQLEKQNKALKSRIATKNAAFKQNKVKFNETARKKQKAFEREFKHDMESLEKSIKDVFKNNTN